MTSVRTDGSRRSTQYKNTERNVTASEASQHAKALEGVLYDSASDILDYQKQCAELLEELQKDSKDAALDSRSDDAVSHCDDGEESARKIGPYLNARHHVAGIHSEVYKASVPSPPPPSYMGTPSAIVALKVTHFSRVRPPHDPEREARLLRQLTHPNILPLYSSFRDGPLSAFVLVLPFLPYTLSDLLSRPSLPAPRSRSLLHDLFSALAHIHAQGLIHRDVKPSNILLRSPSGPALLADFATAYSPRDPTAADEPPTAKITDVGTSHYRAPETLFGLASYGPEIDLWAAGCVAYELLSLSSPSSSSSSSSFSPHSTPCAKPLFDGGATGSDLPLIASIFQTLGTPDHLVWPESAACPDWGKISWVAYPSRTWEEIMPAVGEAGRDLVRSLVRYSASERLRAEQVLGLDYFCEEGVNRGG